MPEERPAPSTRGLWTGSISFGLVNVPVSLFPAYRTVSTGLRMLAPDGTPLERRYWCPREEREVPYDELVRGYELEDGSFVVLTDEDLEGLEPRKSRDIDLRRFVPLDALDPLLFDRAYILGPAGDSTKAYRLLAAVMEETGTAGIATFVMRTREYLVAILARGGVLRAETLRFHDEVRSPEDVGLAEEPAPDAERLAAMKEAVQRARRADIARSELEDPHARALKALARGKRRSGEDVIELGEDAGDGGNGQVIDLMAALKRSLSGEDASRGGESGRRADAASREAGAEGSGSGASPPDLASRTKAELYEEAKRRDIEGRSRMSKDELVRALSGTRRRWR